MLTAALADAAAETSLAGASGWTGAGLLGLVLAWLLLKHLPDKDTQMAKLLATKDEQLAGMVARHDTVLAAKEAAFAGALQRVTEHCEREMSAISSGVVAELRRLSEAVSQRHG